jgi:hypothetical protein
MSRDQDLFRREAVEFSTQRLYGHVVVRPRISHLVWLGLLTLSLVLAIASLLTGVRVEERTVTGTLTYVPTGSQDVQPSRTVAELRLPRSLKGKLEPGQHLGLRIAELAPEAIGMIDAEVESVSSRLAVVRPAADGTLGTVYYPVVLSVSESSLRQAGFPLEAATEFEIQSTVVVARKSWMRWIVDSVAGRAAKT